MIESEANDRAGQEASQGALPRSLFVVLALALALGTVSNVKGIMAGDEAALPADSPASRLDMLGNASQFNAVGALAITSGGFSYKGSATAISPNWVLTAGHNLDLNDNGSPDAGLSMSFSLPGFGMYTASSFHTCPGFTGFGNPSIQRDLGLVHLSTPLPNGILFPSLQSAMQVGDQATLVGFGRSGYGNYGYTTSATLTDRRVGYNVVDSFTTDDLGGGFPALFRYDFDSSDTFGLAGGSLGNNLESLIGPGDSGGPLLLFDGNGYSIAGVNTFIEGYGGRFGDIGGGIVLAPYLHWIGETTGLAVPEPSVCGLLLIGLLFLLCKKVSVARTDPYSPPVFVADLPSSPLPRMQVGFAVIAPAFQSRRINFPRCSTARSFSDSILGAVRRRRREWFSPSAASRRRTRWRGRRPEVFPRP